MVLLQACGDLNSSWENDGGGYIKYQIGDSKTYTLELDEDDVELPTNRRHYFFFQTKIEKSDRKDAFAAMVYDPSLGDNPIVEGYSWARIEGSPKGIIYGDESVIRFDQKDDSTWTADFDFYVQDCRSGICSDSLPRIHITGRFRYWIPADER